MVRCHLWVTPSYVICHGFQNQFARLPPEELSSLAFTDMTSSSRKNYMFLDESVKYAVILPNMQATLRSQHHHTLSYPILHLSEPFSASSMLIRAAVPQVHHPWLPPPIDVVQKVPPAAISCRLGTPQLRSLKTSHGLCKARRRVRYEEEDDDEDTEEHAQNSEISSMEAYSEAVRDVALVVRATVDGEEETVLVFKGFSSCLSSRTSYDPSKSVLPARAVIECIDVVRGPFDPSNVEYLEKDLTWEAFKTRLQSNNR